MPTGGAQSQQQYVQCLCKINKFRRVKSARVLSQGCQVRSVPAALDGLVIVSLGLWGKQFFTQKAMNIKVHIWNNKC